jgi:hypothetical protein
MALDLAMQDAKMQIRDNADIMSISSPKQPLNQGKRHPEALSRLPRLPSQITTPMEA